MEIWAYLGVPCEAFLCFVATIGVRVYYADFFVFCFFTSLIMGLEIASLTRQRIFNIKPYC